MKKIGKVMLVRSSPAFNEEKLFWYGKEVGDYKRILMEKKKMDWKRKVS